MIYQVVSDLKIVQQRLAAEQTSRLRVVELKDELQLRSEPQLFTGTFQRKEVAVKLHVPGLHHLQRHTASLLSPGFLGWRLQPVIVIRVGGGSLLFLQQLLLSGNPLPLVEPLHIQSQLFIIDESCCARGLAAAPASSAGGDPLCGTGST